MMPARVLIFIVAYNAEKTISSVLRRIPGDRLPDDTEVLIIDDSSDDSTYARAKASVKECPLPRITVLRNPVNQGYGGNQKLGYEFAIQRGFDVVALVHGDGQYAPEKLPSLLQPVIDGEADACFGSRMMEKGTAIRQGMPRYKYAGNRVLTFLQNRMLRANLSEFHSGYRVYSVAALKKVPFRHNTNDFHFDTEIIIQFLMAGLRIVELPIPTYYGDEICYVNGIAYAWNVLMATLASRIHGMGLLFQRKFDVYSGQDVYHLKTGYPSSHSFAIDSVPPGSKVLDLACGPGYVAAELAGKQCRVTGVDLCPPAMNSFEQFILHDLDNGAPPTETGTYDIVLALDCVEHLNSPERFLSGLRQKFYSERTRLILTTPNIGFIVTRLGLLIGQFNYGIAGILDMTHKRLFTFRSARRLLEQGGCRILQMKGIPPPFPKALGDNRISRFLMAVSPLFVFFWPTMFAYQIYIEALFLPPVDRLLDEAISTLPDREEGRMPE